MKTIIIFAMLISSTAYANVPNEKQFDIEEVRISKLFGVKVKDKLTFSEYVKYTQPDVTSQLIHLLDEVE